MSGADVTLYWFSVGFAVVIALLLLVPVLRRQNDVLTTWNFFLVGAFIFNGMSGLNAATVPHYLPSLSRSSYLLYYLGVIVFYVTITLTYYGFKTPRRLAGRTMLNWPEVSSVTAPLIAGCLMGLGAFVIFPLPIPFIGQLLSNMALVAPSFALAVMTVAYFRNKSNVVLLSFLLLFTLLAVSSAVASGISRRYVISALAAIPVSIYWVWLRYKTTPQILAVLALAAATTVPMIAGFTALRFSLSDENASGIQRVQKFVSALPDAIKSGGSSEGFTGQDSVECALSVIQLLNDGSKGMEVHPLATLWLMVTNPIPRSMMEDKPESIGVNLINYFGLRGTNANLGLNVVGQCYYDGGLPVIVLYAFMMGTFLRYYDELLVRRPGNPLLIGGLVAMSSQLMGWPRGCIGIMGMQIAQSFILVIVTAWIARTFLGTKVVYPRTDHITNYPVLRSAKDWQRWMGSFTGITPAGSRQTLPSE